MKARSAPFRFYPPVVLSVALVLVGVHPMASELAKDTKPSVSLKASPNVGFAPVRVVVTAEIKGGANDFEEFYCPTVEWDIVSLDGRGDGNKSEQRLECDPYQSGKSEIRRRYVREQIFRYSGEYSIRFNLKQKNKVVGGARTSVRIRAGLGDGDR